MPKTGSLTAMINNEYHRTRQPHVNLRQKLTIGCQTKANSIEAVTNSVSETLTAGTVAA